MTKISIEYQGAVDDALTQIKRIDTAFDQQKKTVEKLNIEHGRLSGSTDRVNMSARMAGTSVDYLEQQTRQAGEASDIAAEKLDQLEQEARQAATATGQLAASSDRAAQANTRLATTKGTVTAASGGFNGAIVGVTKGVIGLTIALMGAEQAYRATKAAADKWSTDGADGFATMESSWSRAFGTLLKVPIAGRGVIDWIDDGAAALGRQMEANAEWVISAGQVVGLLGEQEAGHLRAGLAAEDHTLMLKRQKEEMEKLNKWSEDLIKKWSQDQGGTVFNAAAWYNAQHKGNLIGVPRTDYGSFAPAHNPVGGHFPNPASPVSVALNLQVNASEMMTEAQANRVAQQIAPRMVSEFKRMGIQLQGTGMTR
jgi:hypothetical protein